MRIFYVIKISVIAIFMLVSCSECEPKENRKKVQIEKKEQVEKKKKKAGSVTENKFSADSLFDGSEPVSNFSYQIDGLKQKLRSDKYALNKENELNKVQKHAACLVKNINPSNYIPLVELIEFMDCFHKDLASENLLTDFIKTPVKFSADINRKDKRKIADVVISLANKEEYEKLTGQDLKNFISYVFYNDGWVNNDLKKNEIIKDILKIADEPNKNFLLEQIIIRSTDRKSYEILNELQKKDSKIKQKVEILVYERLLLSLFTNKKDFGKTLDKIEERFLLEDKEVADPCVLVNFLSDDFAGTGCNFLLKILDDVTKKYPIGKHKMFSNFDEFGLHLSEIVNSIKNKFPENKWKEFLETKSKNGLSVMEWIENNVPVDIRQTFKEYILEGYNGKTGFR